MSIVMELRKCPACGRTYRYNPDVGKIRCPYCFGLGKIKKLPNKKPKKGGFFG